MRRTPRRDCDVAAGLSHVALVVRDPQRSAQLFADAFGVEIVLPTWDTGGVQERIVRLFGVEIVFRKGEGPARNCGDHLGFSVSASDLLAYKARLAALGVGIEMAREDTALYFSDYDHHLFELDSYEGWA